MGPAPSPEKSNEATSGQACLAKKETSSPWDPVTKPGTKVVQGSAHTPKCLHTHMYTLSHGHTFTLTPPIHTPVCRPEGAKGPQTEPQAQLTSWWGEDSGTWGRGPGCSPGTFGLWSQAYGRRPSRAGGCPIRKLLSVRATME